MRIHLRPPAYEELGARFRESLGSVRIYGFEERSPCGAKPIQTMNQCKIIAPAASGDEEREVDNVPGTLVEGNGQQNPRSSEGKQRWIP